MFPRGMARTRSDLEPNIRLYELKQKCQNSTSPAVSPQFAAYCGFNRGYHSSQIVGIVARKGRMRSLSELRLNIAASYAIHSTWCVTVTDQTLLRHLATIVELAKYTPCVKIMMWYQPRHLSRSVIVSKSSLFGPGIRESCLWQNPRCRSQWWDVPRSAFRKATR